MPIETCEILVVRNAVRAHGEYDSLQVGGEVLRVLVAILTRSSTRPTFYTIVKLLDVGVCS